MMNHKNKNDNPPRAAATTMEPAAGRRGEPVDVYYASGSKPLATSANKRTNLSHTTPTTATTNNSTPTSSQVDEVMEWLEHKTKLGSSDLEQGRQRHRGNDEVEHEDAEDDDDDFDCEGNPGLATPQFIYRSVSDDASTLSTLSTRRSVEPPGLYYGAPTTTTSAATMLPHVQQQPQPSRPMMLTDMSTSDAVAILVRGPSTADDDDDDNAADPGTTTTTTPVNLLKTTTTNTSSQLLLATNSSSSNHDEKVQKKMAAQPQPPPPPLSKPPPSSSVSPLLPSARPLVASKRILRRKSAPPTPPPPPPPRSTNRSLGSRDASGKILHTNNNKIPTSAIDDDDDDDDDTDDADNEIAEPMEDAPLVPPASSAPPSAVHPDPEGGAYSESSDTISCHDDEAAAAAVEEEEEDGEDKYIKAILDYSPETTAAAAGAAASHRPRPRQQQQQQQPGAYNVPGRRPSSSMQRGTAACSFAHVTAAAAAPVTAVLVSSNEEAHHVMAELVHEEDSTTARNNNNDKKCAGSNDPSRWSNYSRMRTIGIVLLVVLGIVVIGLVAALVGNKKSHAAAAATSAPTPTPPPIDPNDLWYEVMDPIDGSPGSDFGSSVSMCSDGSRIAIGAQGSGEVQVYELNEATEGGRKQLGQTILRNNVTGTTSVPFIRSQVVVELARNCDILAIGYPFANVGDKQMAGQVEMYEYDASLDSWKPLGDPHIIPGEEAGDFAGASISLSQTGDRVAIGSPGNDWAGEDAGRARVFLVNRGGWELLGTAINGTFPGEEFGGSISLTSDDSADTYILAVGSSTLRTTPLDEFVFTLSAEVARVYEFQTGTWYQRGQGIVPGVLGIDTAWFVKLSADGKKLVVSNLYLDPDGVRITDGEVNSGIYVAAFEIDMMMTNWLPRGGNIHANFPGQKSGYIISLSDDGSRIGMGDPGRAEGGGLAGHSHFYEFIDDRWCQLGPNIHGESAGDMAGYSVSMSGDGKRMVVASPKSRAQGRDHGRVIVVELHEELIVPKCEGISF